MEVLDLLDCIDETAPRGCQTCVHMATHEKCDLCLHPDGVFSGPMAYADWEPGNWMRRVHEWECSGRAVIVIGGTGEAEVTAGVPPAEAAKHLHYVAEECGYSCGTLQRTGLSTDYITYWTDMGQFKIVWEDEQLDRIERLTDEGPVLSWSRSTPI